MKFYHYAHCPFCIRVRLAFGFLNQEFESIVLPYNDEKTPIYLVGKKMLPIVDFGNIKLNESLDIINKIDSENILNTDDFKKNKMSKMDELLNSLGKNIHNLAMPYWIYTPEFDEISREYFKSKKEVKRGPFKQLVKNRATFSAALNDDLAQLELTLTPFHHSTEFGLEDILLASHLWGMYVVPEFQFSSTIHSYLQKVGELCKFNYHEDFWK
jgi:glutaredoxin 2